MLVIKLSKDSKCFDKLIRKININSLQRGELLNHVKDQMKTNI